MRSLDKQASREILDHFGARVNNCTEKSYNESVPFRRGFNSVFNRTQSGEIEKISTSPLIKTVAGYLNYFSNLMKDNPSLKKQFSLTTTFSSAPTSKNQTEALLMEIPIKDFLFKLGEFLFQKDVITMADLQHFGSMLKKQQQVPVELVAQFLADVLKVKEVYGLSSSKALVPFLKFLFKKLKKLNHNSITKSDFDGIVNAAYKRRSMPGFIKEFDKNTYTVLTHLVMFILFLLREDNLNNWTSFKPINAESFLSMEFLFEKNFDFTSGSKDVKKFAKDFQARNSKNNSDVYSRTILRKSIDDCTNENGKSLLTKKEVHMLKNEFKTNLLVDFCVIAQLYLLDENTFTQKPSMQMLKKLKGVKLSEDTKQTITLVRDLRSFKAAVDSIFASQNYIKQAALFKKLLNCMNYTFELSLRSPEVAYMYGNLQVWLSAEEILDLDQAFFENPTSQNFSDIMEHADMQGDEGVPFVPHVGTSENLMLLIKESLAKHYNSNNTNAPPHVFMNILASLVESSTVEGGKTIYKDHFEKEHVGRTATTYDKKFYSVGSAGAPYFKNFWLDFSKSFKMGFKRFLSKPFRTLSCVEKSF